MSKHGCNLGYFKSEKDDNLPYLETQGPARITHSITVEENVEIDGPLELSGTLQTKKAEINGPLTMKGGKLNANEVVEINGPFDINNGNFEAAESEINGPLRVTSSVIKSGTIEINGPLKVLSDSNFDVQTITINGPLKSEIALRFNEATIHGPVDAKDTITANKIIIEGPVNIEGSLIATDSIEIKLGSTSSRQTTLVQCKSIEAPVITISSKRGVIPVISANLKGQTITLRKVQHTGSIEGQYVLEDGATHND